MAAMDRVWIFKFQDWDHPGRTSEWLLLYAGGGAVPGGPIGFYRKAKQLGKVDSVILFLGVSASFFVTTYLLVITLIVKNGAGEVPSLVL